MPVSRVSVLRLLPAWFAAAAMLCISTRPATAAAPLHGQQVLSAQAGELFALANQSRIDAGAPPLTWDAALAEAALRHCLRMAVEADIAHRYSGEPDLTERAASAGARFRLIEENIAVGSYTQTIHQGWLRSPQHRENLLNPDVDRIGVAVVAAQGVIFAVEDFSHAVPVLSQTQVESTFARLILSAGIPIRRDPVDARAACARDHGLPADAYPRPRYILRFQGAELGQLPPDLASMLASHQYREASVGSCPVTDSDNNFTAYRLAVLLY